MIVHHPKLVYAGHQKLPLNPVGEFTVCIGSNAQRRIFRFVGPPKVGSDRLVWRESSPMDIDVTRIRDLNGRQGYFRALRCVKSQQQRRKKRRSYGSSNNHRFHFRFPGLKNTCLGPGEPVLPAGLRIPSVNQF
jgi:hypothetical protein